MSKLRIFLFSIFVPLLALVLFSGGAASPAGAQEAGPPAVPGEIIISYGPSVTAGAIQAFQQQNGLQEVDDLSIGSLTQTKLVSVPGEATSNLLQQLGNDPRVRFAEPNYIVSIGATPNDPSFGSLWGLHNTGQTGGTPDADIDAPEAWDITTGSQSIIVGIIDTGVNYLHPDLAANMWTNPNEIPGDGIDNDNNNYIDDIHGINAITGSGDPMDDNSHGSHTAGTIGGVGNNGLGVAGVNWSVSIIGCKFLNAAGSGNTANAIKCLQYFNHQKQVQGANILATNNSWGGGGFSQALKDAFEGLDQPLMPKILHLTAAGNANNNNDIFAFYPANYDLSNLISVAATDHNDLYAGFSNYGATTVDMAAPGVSILSTVLGTSYGFKSGTSMATPHVAGAAALAYSLFPNLSAVDMKQFILNNLDDISGLGNNFQKPTLTGGRLNVGNMLNSDSTPPAAVTDLAQSGADLTSITVGWTASGDDGAVGQATSYDVRYSAAPINEGNWAGATQATGEPVPQPSGAPESFTIAGLDHSTGYFIGLKVADEANNQSPLSNVLLANTQTATTVFSDDMESGLGNWAAVGVPGLWHQSTNRALSPTTSWYYGIEGVFNYNTGGSNSGTLTSEPISLPVASQLLLNFEEWSEVEGLASFDRTRVQISTDAVTYTTVFESHGTSGVWESRSLDLTAYSGSTIHLRYWFDSIDGFFNNFEGWYIDDVEILAVGAAPNDPPVADPGGPYSGTEDLALAFDGSGSSDPDGDPLTYAWDFGDGNTGTGVAPSHTYLAGGIYMVSLVVNDGTVDSAPVTTTATVTEVNDPPVADPGGPYSGTEDLALAFDGSGSSDPDGDPLTYAWDFGDGNTGTGVAPSHTYLAGGIYTVSLVVNDGTVDSAPATTTATIAAANQPPVSDPGGPYSGTANVALTFDGSGSSDPDGDPLTYAWDFGDGNNGTGISPTHTYGAAGIYTVTLVVSDGLADSAPATTTATIAAANQPPVANPGGPYFWSDGFPLSFDGSGSSDPDGDPLTYAWDFGDGNNGTGVTPTHTYPAAGVYTVTLVVNDGLVDSPPASTTATIFGSSSFDIAITDFRARNSRRGEYRVNADVRNEDESVAAITANLEILDSSGNVVDVLPDKTVTIDADDEVELMWRDPTSLPNGDYTARITIADEQPPEVDTDSFRVR